MFGQQALKVSGAEYVGDIDDERVQSPDNLILLPGDNATEVATT
jgi:hypothetical protein